MIEKIEMGKCLSELPAGGASKIVGINGVNGVLTTPVSIAETGRCLMKKNLYAHSIKGYYSNIASIYPILQEGVDSQISLLINGGNNYAVPACIIALSLIVQKNIVSSEKNNIISSLEIGYVKNENKLDIWIKRSAYSHNTEVLLLSSSANTKLVSDFNSDTIPDGYTII